MTEKKLNNHKNGKGSIYRIPLDDKKYKKNYNKIFRKKR